MDNDEIDICLCQMNGDTIQSEMKENNNKTKKKEYFFFILKFVFICEWIMIRNKST